MTLEYFNKQIHEELDGAKEYIERAIEAKINHPMWVSKFSQMADMEASHAANLMKMLEECIKTKKRISTLNCRRKSSKWSFNNHNKSKSNTSYIC